MLPSTDKALLTSVTVLLVGGIVIGSAVPAVAASHGSTAVDFNDAVQENDTEQENETTPEDELTPEDEETPEDEMTPEDDAEQDNETAEDEAEQEEAEDELPDWNVRLSSDGTFWQNQRAYFDGAEVVNNASIKPIGQASEEARTFEVRTVEDGTLGSNVDEFQVNETGIAVINMSGYEPGEYALVYEEMPVAVDDGEGEFVSDASEAAFEVDIQNLSASFDPDQVSTDGTTQFEVESNRDDSFLVSVKGSGLHQAQVTAIFDEAEPFENTSVRNGTIFRVDDDVEVQANEAPIDPGRYQFRIDVIGAQASDTASLTIGDPEEINETMGNESNGPGAADPGNDTGAPGGNGDLFTDTPDEGTDDETPTESEPPGEESPTETDDGDETETGTTTTETGPGFGLLVAAIGLLGAGLLARRRTA
ncbi:PGF-CTERM sorting domain-containing protein [Halorientalis salina]|uniref:PGF-CTERM sorting domain-containing protein n=1 Tax=Halorientalis salina TaxID=2932266 RepID=UPI0010ACC25F|nr:PGF-CTERM sorting domain-containing protein [Halorientalis salina]